MVHKEITGYVFPGISCLGAKSITDSPTVNSLVALRVCLFFSVVVVLIQITLGGFVRVSGSGLGCPDWPLCDGRIVPVFERSAIIEFSHRAVASVVLLSSFVSSVFAWRFVRNDLSILVPALIGTVLVLVAAVLGAIVVWTELAWWVRIIHLTIAESVVAFLILSLIASFKSNLKSLGKNVSIPKRNIGLLVSLAAIMVVILSGSHMVGYGAGSSCATWPLCRGELFPDGTAYMIHMSHRFIAGFTSLLLSAVLFNIWKSPSLNRLLRFSILSVIIVLVFQLIIGAATVWTGFSIQSRTAHLGGATLLWTCTVALASVIYFSSDNSKYPNDQGIP